MSSRFVGAFYWINAFEFKASARLYVPCLCSHDNQLALHKKERNKGCKNVFYKNKVDVGMVVCV